MANYIKLEFWNTCDLGNVYYAGGFKNLLILDTDIGKPEYTDEEEGFDNGDGVFIKTFMKRVKNYKFEVLVPEYVADALTFMAMHNNIRLTFTNGLYSSTIRNVKVEIDWQEDTNDCMALAKVSFQQDDQVLNSNCCINLP